MRKRKGKVNGMSVLNMTATGENIRILMEQAGVTAAEVAEALGLTTPNAAYRWMRGTSVPSIDNLLMLRDILNAGIDEILVTDHVA